MRSLATFASRTYRRAMRFYPADFRAAFGDEMQTIFEQALDERVKKSWTSALWFCLLELKDFPVSLLSQHWQGLWNKGGKMSAISKNAQNSSTPLRTAPPQRGSWRESFLAGLPHLSMGLLIGTGKILPFSASSQVLMFLVMALFCLVVGLLIFAWRQRWPLWSASWYLYGTWVVLALVSLSLERLHLEKGWVYSNALVLTWIAVCLLGYFRLLLHDRLKGLLAVAFLFPFLGILMLEFIPDVIEGWLAIVLGTLAAVAAASVVRRGEFGAALGLVLGINAITGLVLAYVGEYQIKDLPANIPAHIPQFAGFLSLLGFYTFIGMGIIAAPFLLQGLWRYGKRALFG